MPGTGDTFGDFELLDELGRGGMGVVYRARQLSLGREVAVKALPASMAEQGNTAARFETEARRMARLSHPNVAQVFVVGQEGETRYFAMQLLPGGTLADRLSRGPLHLDDAVRIATEVARALEHAHGSEITHRDIKPANIMFDAQGNAVVTDFGIAKAADDTRHTATGTAVGTPQYMAPEQARGNPSDGRADIYALGVVLYEMVCGRPPFTGETPVSIAMKHLSEPPMPPRTFRADVPEWLQSVILKALAKEPADRFASAGDMAGALSARVAVACPAPTDTVGAPGNVDPSPPWPKRTAAQWPMIAVAMLVVLGLGIIGAVTLRDRGGRTPEPTETAGIPPGNEEDRPIDVETPQTMLEVPGVIGKTAAEAEITLGNRGFRPVQKPARPSDVFEAGLILSQDPPAGRRVEHGSEVSLVKSSGPEPRPAPPPDPPAGWSLDQRWSNSRDRWSIGYPSGWTPESSSDTDDGFEYRRTKFISPDGSASFLVERGPADESPLASAEDLSRRYAKAYGDRYSRIGIQETTLAGYPAARWEFVARKNNETETWHKIDVFVNAEGRGYAVLCQAHVDRWDEYVSLFEQVIDSFAPEG